MGNVRILEVKQSIFESNDKQAALLREELKKDGVFLLNLMSSPRSVSWRQISTLTWMRKQF